MTIKDPNDNWNLAILTGVILILLFFWYYKFLFYTNPLDLSSPIPMGLYTSDIKDT